MALKVLLLRKRLDEKKNELEELRALDPRMDEKEKELEAAIAEAVSDEDKAAVEGLVDEFEGEKKDHEAAKASLTAEIAGLEQDLKEAEETAPESSGPSGNQGGGDGGSPDTRTKNNESRKDDGIMKRTVRGFGRMDMQSRNAFVAREEVKDFLQRVRELGVEKRAVTGAQLTIPEVVLSLLRENIADYSKLLAHVNLQSVAGTARQTIMGVVPEAIWTEACATLNELDLSFSAVEVDGYMVGGFIPICNAVLEDSDVNLAGAILDALGKAIGYAVDKAIIYGTGNKMPLGVVTRLAQTAKPSDWAATAPEWKNISASNVKKLAVKTGTAFFQQLVLATGSAKSTYSRSGLTWVMNDTTKKKMVAEALAVNAAGAIVSGIENTMPVVGGDIVTLDFMADDDIVFGYFDLYLLAERAGAQMGSSEHVRFIQNQTVFKGTARYDGTPVFGDAFSIVNINNTAPTTSVTFAPDKANTAGDDDDGGDGGEG